MQKQEITNWLKKQIFIENYSEQTIKNYSSVLKLFLEWVEKLKVEKITNSEIQDYLYYCKKEKKYSYSTMKQVIATISFLYSRIFNKPIPRALDIKLRKPTHLPTVLSAKDISKIITVTTNLKHKRILILIYSGGLRLGELFN